MLQMLFNIRATIRTTQASQVCMHESPRFDVLHLRYEAILFVISIMLKLNTYLLGTVI